MSFNYVKEIINFSFMINKLNLFKMILLNKEMDYVLLSLRMN